MADDHENISSNDESVEDDDFLDGDDDPDLHKSISSDKEGEFGDEGEEGVNTGDLVENGHDIATHGGGTIEVVPGFDESFALTEGFPREEIPVSHELAMLRYCCPEMEAPPESVCGRDDRVRIQATTRIPWRMICQLIITSRTGSMSRCTGWFIGPRAVMTAGHCVYSHSAGGWPKKIDVIPGLNSTLRPYGSLSSSSFCSVKGWVNKKKKEYDYGVIFLPNKSLGNRVGWFGFAALTDASLKNLLVNNAGYAGDKPFGTLWFNAGRITKVKTMQLEYMIDTYGGHSGSPTWRLRNNLRHAVGIHAYGGCPNASTRITASVFKNMKAWKAR